MFKQFIYFFMVLLLTSCAGLDKKPEAFKVNISSIKILDSTLMEQRYQVSLRILNKTRETYDVEGISFDIELNGKDFASGVSNQNIQIEPLSESVISVDVSSTIFGIIRQINNMQNNQTKAFNYELSGTLYSSGSLMGIPFRETGEIDLKPSMR